MSRSDFHPDLRRVAPLLPRSMGTPRKMRFTRRLEPLMARRRPPEGLEIEMVGDREIRVHRPPADGAEPSPALLWIHGGGFIIGNPAQDDSHCALLARELGIPVAAASYRLAPEHPFPAALDDCHDALVWLAGREGIDPTQVAIGGASAGGGLAAALALAARERGEVAPVFQLLSYPMLDDRTVIRTDLDERNMRLWNNRSNRFGWQSYLGRAPGSAGVSGLAAPARHEDLAGLPPAWIGVGTLDLFHDEDLAYAERLRAAGVPCEVHVVEGAFHGFDGVRAKAPVSVRYVAEQVRALRAGLGVSAAGS